VAERTVVVSEASRRWLCGEVAASEYFAAAHAAQVEQARRDIADRLNGVHDGPRSVWSRLLTRVTFGAATG
jgi:hypothetical protein